MDAARRLLLEIEDNMHETARWTGRRALSPAVHAAMLGVRREAFVRPGDEDFAYANRPLSIGHGQTISQPFIVALMTELLDPEPDARVLEIGTGCGYQSAVLAEVVRTVYSVEVVAELAEASRERLRLLGYDNVHVHWGDGYAGWPEHAPYDGILVTAAAREVPEALVEQLAEGGRMVIPIGPPFSAQELLVVTKRDGEVATEQILPVAFVPMVPGDD